jgi:hypothetical protein
MFSCFTTLLFISTLRFGTVSKCAAFMLLREFKMMLVGSPTCSRCKQAFEMVSCVPCDWGNGHTKIRGPGSALYETGWLWQHFIQQGTALPKCVGCTEDWIFSKCQVTMMPTHMYSVLFYCLRDCFFSKIIKVSPNLILIHGRFVTPSSVNSQTLWGSNVWTCGNILFKAYQAYIYCTKLIQWTLKSRT